MKASERDWANYDPPFWQPPPGTTVYHYTSVEALQSILTGRCIRASRLDLMSDLSEYKHGEKIFQSAVNKVKRRAPEAIRDQIDALFENRHVFDKESIFVASFSLNGDLLSQWRSYTPPSNGCCIGFDPSLLDKLLHKQHCARWIRCEYTLSRKRAMAANFLYSHLKLRPPYAELSSLSFFPYTIAAMKHPAYRAEKEARILSVCKDPSKVRHAARTGRAVPFIEWIWGSAGDTSNFCPVKSITIAPCKTQAVLEQVVKIVLKESGHQQIPINKSAIPYRGI